MNNKIVKGLILVAAIGGILTWVFLSLNRLSKTASTRIPPLNFVAYVTQAANKTISQVSPVEATSAYNRLYSEVQTEASIVCQTKSGVDSSLLSSIQTDSCFSILFESYFPRLQSRAQSLFNSSDWIASERDFIMQEAARLNSMRGTSSRKDSLDRYISYIKAYDSAIRLKKKAEGCRNSRLYESICREAEQYCKWPWCNANAIGRSFKLDVSEKAKTAWRQSAQKNVDYFVQRDGRYYQNNISPLDTLNRDYSRLYDAINDYHKTFSNSVLSDYKSKLDNAYIRIKGEIEEYE